jgi:VWFA-related protein
MFRGARMRVGPTLLLLACLAPPARGAEPVPPGPPPTVSAEAALVRVSVSVHEKDGRAVTDLTAGDFVLLDRGRAQAIVQLEGPAAPPDRPADAEPTLPPVPTEPRPASRHIVLAIDDLHVSDAHLVSARAALVRFVERQLGPEDRVAVVTTSGAGVSRSFTADRSALLRAIEALRSSERRPDAGGRATLNEAHAEAIERNDPEALETAIREIESFESTPQRNPRLQNEVRSMARQIVAQFVRTSAGVLGFVEAIVRSLEPLPGRKLVILVSDGFLLGPQNDPSTFDLRRLQDASARADVAVYPLDSRGLGIAPAGGAAAVASRMDAGARQRYERLNELSRIDTMTAIAEGTGGRFIRGTNDLEAGLDVILRDSAASYLLGYAPPEGDGKRRFHEIEVKVPARPHLVVRARRGYFSRGDDAPPSESKEAAAARREREIREALAALAPRREVPIRLRADFVDRPPEGSQLVLSAHVDLKGVRFDRAGGRHKADLEFVRVIADESGRVVAAPQGETASLDLSPANYERLLAEGIGYQTSVPLAPGRYEARLVVREARLSQIGSAIEVAEIPDVRSGGLALSGIFLSRRSSGGASELEIAQTARRFASGAELYYAVHVYNPRRAEDGAADVVLQAQIRRADALQGVSPVEPVRFGAKPGAEPVRGRISLEGLTAGTHELRLVAVDKKANVQAERRIDFVVE